MFKLSAKLRDIFGKKTASLRLAGEIPVVVYDKDKTTSLTVNTIEFKKILKEAGESSIVSLAIAGKETDVLIHEVQFDPISGEPVHADFYIVSQDKEIEVDVPLVFEGIAPAIKELNGNLVKVMHELPISALPKNLPHDIKVDVSNLAVIGSQILVKDLDLPLGVTVTIDNEEVVALIAEVVEEVIEETAPIDLSTIEVEKKGKKEEEGEEEATSDEK